MPGYPLRAAGERAALTPPRQKPKKGRSRPKSTAPHQRDHTLGDAFIYVYALRSGICFSCNCRSVCGCWSPEKTGRGWTKPTASHQRDHKLTIGLKMMEWVRLSLLKELPR